MSYLREMLLAWSSTHTYTYSSRRAGVTQTRWRRRAFLPQSTRAPYQQYTHRYVLLSWTIEMYTVIDYWSSFYWDVWKRLLMLRVNQHDWDEGEDFTHLADINFSARYLSNVKIFMCAGIFVYKLCRC